MSNKSVLPERCGIVSSKSVLQECHLSVSSEGVPQVVSLENVTNKYCQYCVCSSTYVSAFGFVGFILFSFDLGERTSSIVPTKKTFALTR